MTILIEKNLPVPMRDGTVLRADVYRPSGGGRHPVLIQRTPYNKELMPLIGMTLDPLRAAAAGYVVLVQDVRSRWASEGGPFVLYGNEAEDGFDTAEWAAGQDWSDGSAGGYGLSYMGGTTWLTAITAHPSLRAISPTTAPCEFHGEAIPAGTRIHLAMGAANRDPAHFDDPDELKLMRKPNRHLAFAGGPHLCVGFQLARMEGRIAVNRFLKKYPNYQLTGNAELGGRLRFRGYAKLPAKLN